MRLPLIGPSRLAPDLAQFKGIYQIIEDTVEGEKKKEIAESGVSTEAVLLSHQYSFHIVDGISCYIENCQGSGVFLKRLTSCITIVPVATAGYFFNIHFGYTLRFSWILFIVDAFFVKDAFISFFTAAAGAV